jgi:beta-lactamase class A
MNRREFNKLLCAFGGLTLAAPLVAISEVSPRSPSEVSSPKDTDDAKRRPSRATGPHLSDLDERIRQYIRQARREGLIADDEATSWSVYDFTSGRQLVAIKEDIPRECASMMKPFVALAFFHCVQKQRFSYSSQRRRLMERMIQRSSNSATNQAMDLIGGPEAVDRILKAEYPGIFRQTKIVEYIPLGGRTYMNKASAYDYNRFLHAVWTDRVPHAREIRRLMALPNSDRIYDGVPNIPTGTLVYHKTGTTARLCGDFGLLVPKDREGKRYPYTLVAIIEKGRRTSNLSRWIGTRSRVIRKVSSLVYDDIKTRHNLV